MRLLYDWMIHWAQKPQATWALFFFSFIESSFFPIPPDPLLMAMTTLRPKRWFYLASVCLLASVLGGAFGYFIGVTLYETVGQAIINLYHLQEGFESLGQRYSNNAFITIFTAAFTPIPYKLITISAGVFRVNFAIFMIASVIGRGARFFAVAYLLHHFGARFKDKIEKYFDILSLLFVVLLIAGFVVFKWVV